MGASTFAKNKVAFFRANYNGTAWNIYSGLTGTTAASGPSSAAYTLKDLIEEGKYDFQDDGTLKVSWTQYHDDENIYNFIDTVAVTEESAGGRNEVVMEDGQKLSSGATSGNYVLMLAYTTEANGKVKTIAAVGNISPASGSFGTKYDSWTQPTLEFTAVKVPSDLSIPANLFDMYNASTNPSGVLASSAVSAAQVIPNKKAYIRKYFDKKA